MIDPKLNEIPAKRSQTNLRNDAESTATAARPAEGLSIKDTIAGDTTLSVGSRGVDTSGVKTGAGAGGGSTFVTPGTDASPAVKIAPSAKLNTAGQGSIDRADTGLPGAGTTDAAASGPTDSDISDEPTWEEISTRAYGIWCEQGCLEGTDEHNWRAAEEELRRARQSRSRTATA